MRDVSYMGSMDSDRRRRALKTERTADQCTQIIVPVVKLLAKVFWQKEEKKERKK
jgi:hypothetical protein